MIQKIKDFINDLHNQAVYAKWVWKYSLHHFYKILKILIIGITSSVAGISISLLVKQLIDAATTHTFNSKYFFIYSALFIFSEVIAVVWNYLSIKYDEQICQDVRKRLLSSILHAEWTQISEYKNGDLQTRMTNNVDCIADGISDVIPSLFSFMLQLILTLVVLAYYNITIAMVALITGIIGVGLFFIFKGKIYQLQLRVQEKESISRSHMIECCSNIAFIKSFTAENQSIGVFDAIQKDKFGAILNLASSNNRTTFLLNMIFNITYLSAFGLGIFFLSDNTISYGTLSLYIVLAGQIQGPMVSIAKSIPQIIWTLSSAGRIKEITELTSEVKQTFEFPNEAYGIHCEKVTYSYNNNDNTVLNNATFDIHPGEIVGLVGKSGSGKTTTINLILSLLTPQNGLIEFVSQSGKRYSAGTATRKLCGYVPQDNMLISGTIAQNICFGTDVAENNEQVINALKIAEAYDFVSKTPDGIETVIDEQGKGLSRGQAQRIAIARSFVKGAPIIIMDEATSALDSETESAIIQNIMQMEHRPTCLFITH